MATQFIPTHRVLVDGISVDLMLLPNSGATVGYAAPANLAGPAYTYAEWASDSAADHEFDGEEWTFQGQHVATPHAILDDFRDATGAVNGDAFAAWRAAYPQMHCTHVGQ